MGFEAALAEHDLILTEGSMYERLRRHPGVEYDEHIVHSSLIYDEGDARILGDVHREYIAVAQHARLPMIVGAATWRASAERIARSTYADRGVNQDNVAFARAICDEQTSQSAPLLVAGSLGPRGNAYQAKESLDVDEAERFHSAQAEALAEAGPDVLLAMTLPALPEARGIARAVEATGLPYMVSFVVRETGTLLDGTPLGEAIDQIDQESGRAPIGFFVNCVHPSVLDGALRAAGESVAARVMGFRANTSDKRPEELDLAEELITEDPEVLAGGVARVREAHGLTIVGGCCGTGTEHMEEIARQCGGPS